MSECEQELVRARQRIEELNQIITGDRPDKFHDSLVRGSRVARMEQCVSALKAIDNLITKDALPDHILIKEVQKIARAAWKSNPDFGNFKV